MTYSEGPEASRPRRVLTGRARAQANNWLVHRAHPAAQVALKLGAGRLTVMRAVREFEPAILDGS
ncbi:hypothetical protein [Aeromicrobium sp.]|uniref:hypothetical protein n=1 Tax=Aeromicrobium sp. TaxID=1871063 RepID=UPI0019BAF797|nr:hypothetical protein [Aeromicrobium sp.]MBC7631331.1 hypothetical protein [Aeromicrobium sp.]